MRIAAKVRRAKERHPERWCAHPRCLFRTDSEWCSKHDPNPSVLDVERVASYTMEGARDAAGRRPNQARFRDRLQKPLYGLLTPSEAPRRHQPLLVREPGAEWRPLLRLHDGGQS